MLDNIINKRNIVKKKKLKIIKFCVIKYYINI